MRRARRPIRPAFVGEGDRIFTLRTMEDTFRLDDFLRAASPARALVVGGGFIGIETAENLAERGVRVTLVQMEDQVMLPFDYDMACILRAQLLGKGIDLRLDSKVTDLRQAGDAVTAQIENASPVTADFAMLAIGVLPETSLAAAAGLTLGRKGAVVVDEHMRTSDPDIYAAGDAVQVCDAVTGRAVAHPPRGPRQQAGAHRGGQHRGHPLRLPRRAGLLRAQSVRHDGGRHGAFRARGEGRGAGRGQRAAVLARTRELLPRAAGI